MPKTIDLSTPALYIDKELSWLAFNERVLQEAQDKRVPVIERMRFLGIYSNNLDEFFRVRVADVKRRSLLHKAHGGDAGAERLLADIEAKVLHLNDQFDRIHKEILGALRKRSIYLIDENGIADHQRDWVETYFRNKVMAHIAPIIMTPKVDLVACLGDYFTYMVVDIEKGDEHQYALIEVPTEDCPRFVQLPERSKKRKTLILLDDIIRHCLPLLFGGFFEFDRLAAYSIKQTRDAEYDLNDEIDQSLIDKMSEVMKNRTKADPVRIVFDKEMPAKMQKFLKKKLQLSSYESLLAGNRYRNFKDFIGFPNVGRDYLENRELPALVSKALATRKNAFEAIREQDILLYYPYHRFNNFTEVLRQAAFDPQVEQIKLNMYRVAKKSRIIGYLVDAVRNGKKVTVVVELRARFDEAANMDWAQRMTEAGIRVVVGIPSLKIHSKLCLIGRREAGALKRYAHLGTGNFHEGTARIYTDFSLLTCHDEITEEVENVFAFIEFSYRRFHFKHLMVAPINTRRQLFKLINQELRNAREGRKGEITVKVNNLEDPDLVRMLYRASQAGVRIRMIIRGMCSLVPGIKGVSENIEIISIVDRFLEHARAAVFHNNGDPLVYIGSGDWMQRNIDRRIEVSVPVYDPVLKQRIIDILELQFRDTVKARLVDARQSNRYVPRGNRKKIRSQVAIYDYLKAVEG
ncbi:polyphosphate kinase 1 [Motiliproteus sp. SC1-56]|uniref:polyphosphate kinase 1 n=1 Tax=Motiliproteus sp. SC1-56 TaxID=2799565 RepID=UPI001A8CD82A|nr:polyphosphate kinase 1 [Motiliproteus sp. SC1-56]